MTDKLYDTINTSGFVLKTQQNTDKSSLKNKMDDADKKIPDARRLNKITNVNDLVNKQIMMHKYRTLKLNILSHLTLTSVQVKYSIKR